MLQGMMRHQIFSLSPVQSWFVLRTITIMYTLPRKRSCIITSFIKLLCLILWIYGDYNVNRVCHFMMMLWGEDV